MDRALEAFRLNSKEWGVNVQSLSGSPANFAAYTALIKPGDKLMGLDLYSGGHLTHGFQTETKKISATSLYFNSQSYKVNEDTGLIDYDILKKQALEFKPNLIIAGASAYPRDLDYKIFREIADSVGAFLLVDMSHISGLIAANCLNNPFEYADVVTSTTHKTLRGPRSGIIFSNKKRHPDLDEKIDFAVFPMFQGGPHNHQIAALATQLKEVQNPEFKEYIKQTLKNSKKLAEELMKRGNKLVTNGTCNHMLLWNVRDLGLTGSKVEKICERVHISINKNTIIGDKS
jgi:glycine hydroxymethyltransferase